MNIKCAKGSKENGKKGPYYTPHVLRSRPLRCVALPLCGLFLFILFWFALTPLLFVKLHHMYHAKWPAEWVYYFWVAALVLFVALLAILICLWRCNPQKSSPPQDEYDNLLMKEGHETRHNEFYSISLLGENHEKRGVEKNVEAVPMKMLKNGTEVRQEAPQKSGDLFPRCSVKRRMDKKRPESMDLSTPRDQQKYRSLYVGGAAPTSPLSPRELFFHDLIRSANRSESSITHSFIENEKKICSQVNLDLRKSSECASPEFFIANVSEPKTCANEVFMFVDVDDYDRTYVVRSCEDDDFKF